MEDALKFGMYVLLVLPGFILVQPHEYHLLRESDLSLIKRLRLCFGAQLFPVSTSETETRD